MFLNPIMLFGLGGVSIPIIIHLLNKRKFERVVWAAMRFLKVSVERNQRRIQVEDILLLLVRCLLVALLALVLARPVACTHSSAGLLGQAAVTAVIVLDNSGSMSATDGAESRFAKAKKAAQQIVDTLPTGSSVALMLASDAVAREGGIPEPTHGLKFAKDQIDQAPLSDRATNLYPAIRDAVATLKGRQTSRKEIYVITDGQAAGWAQDKDVQRTLEEVKAEVRARVILVGEPEPANLAVTELRLAEGLAPAEQPLKFEVEVRNYGKQEKNDVTVNFGLDGATSAIDSTLIKAIPADGAARAVIYLRPKGEGYHTVRAWLATGDHVPFDDARTVALRTVKNYPVLVVDGAPGAGPRDSAARFLRAALQPVERAELPDYFIKVTTIASTELDQARLDDYEVVCLVNVPDFSEAAANGFEKLLRRGGGLWFFLGDRVNRSYYNEKLFKQRQILPAAIGEALGRADQNEVAFALQAKGYQHEITTLWNDPAAGMLASARFFRAFDLGELAAAPAQPAPDGPGAPRVVLRFADGQAGGPLAGKPAMVERAWARGRVALFASSADTAWNDMPRRPAIVPLVRRTLGALLTNTAEQLNLRVGAAFTLRPGDEYLNRTATFSRPTPIGKKESVPPEAVSINRDKDGVQVSYDKTDVAGTYKVAIAGDVAPRYFAAQPDPAESSLDRITPAQIDVLGKVAHVVDWKAGMILEEKIEKDRVGTELWIPLAIAALFLATSETLLAHRFSKAK